LANYVEALGGHLELRAVFPENTVLLNIGGSAINENMINGPETTN
jgi:hypothetical protein